MIFKLKLLTSVSIALFGGKERCEQSKFQSAFYRKRGKEMMRNVYLGTRPLGGSFGMAHHWAAAVGDGKKQLWMEVDGGEEEKKDVPNTINGQPETSWHQNGAKLLHRGITARSGAER